MAPITKSNSGRGDLVSEARMWTIETVRGLGLTTTVDAAASILGISRTKAYALAKTGEFPVRLVRIGRRYLVPVPALLELLGVPSSPVTAVRPG